MARLITMACSRPVPVEAGIGKGVQVLPFAEHCDNQERLKIPNRGIVLAALLSSILWMALILVGHEVWMLVR